MTDRRTKGQTDGRVEPELNKRSVCLDGDGGQSEVAGDSCMMHGSFLCFIGGRVDSLDL